MTSQSLERIAVSSPAALICAVPYLLGFHPAGSAVLVWMNRGRIMVTERVDLPSTEMEAGHWAEAVGGHAASAASDSVIALLYPAARAPGTSPWFQDLADALERKPWGKHLEVVLVGEDSWRSLLCDEPTCCPPLGAPIDPEVRDAVAAEFAGRGFAPLESRQSLVDSLSPDPEQADRVARTGRLEGVHGCAMSPKRREEWRDAAIASVLAWLRDRSAAADPERMAHLLLSLRDVRVRDTVLWELAHVRNRRLVAAADQFARLLRCAPAGDVAAVGTCACVAFWLIGDGARAGIALDLALDDEPNYSLAQIYDTALRHCRSPQEWRDAMGVLTRAQCRGAEAL